MIQIFLLAHIGGNFILNKKPIISDGFIIILIRLD